jgi:hypothetical protein
MSETLDKILPAISKAMGAIKRVGKEGRNEHDKYNFASIDAFLEMANPICAEAGLIFHMQEIGFEEFMRKGKYGESAWVKVIYEIIVMHTSGQSLPPVKRSVEVVRSGAQAYGSAQSYCLKQFLRSLLLIPTGDKDDADFQATGDGAIFRDTPAAPIPAEPKRPSSAQMKRDIETLRHDLSDCHSEVTVDALAKVWARKIRAEAWPDEDGETSFPAMVKSLFSARRKELEDMTPITDEPEPEQARYLRAG